MKTLIVAGVLWYWIRKMLSARERRIHTVSCRNAELKIKALSAEIQLMRHKKMCRVCMDQECDLIFLPCSHLSVCRSCGKVLKTCPICRKKIWTTVNVFTA